MVSFKAAYGSNIAIYFGNTDIKIINYGISKKFHNDFKAEELLEKCGMSVEKLVKVIEDYLK